VHYWVDLQSVHGFHCYGNIAPNAKCQQVLVLPLCLLTERWVCDKRMVPTADHNTPQRALSRQIVAGCPGECKKIILRHFPTHFNFKVLLQNAPEYAIFIHKIEKFSRQGHGHLPRLLPQRKGKPLAHPPCSAIVGVG